MSVKTAGAGVKCWPNFNFDILELRVLTDRWTDRQTHSFGCIIHWNYQMTPKKETIHKLRVYKHTRLKKKKHNDIKQSREWWEAKYDYNSKQESIHNNHNNNNNSNHPKSPKTKFKKSNHQKSMPNWNNFNKLLKTKWNKKKLFKNPSKIHTIYLFIIIAQKCRSFIRLFVVVMVGIWNLFFFFVR